MPNGLVVKFGRRGRTYTEKDFRKMPDSDLLDKVIGFAASLPWKDEESRQDTFFVLSIASQCIKDRPHINEVIEQREKAAQEGGTP